MPFEKDAKTGKTQFSFTNFLATLVFTQASFFFFWISFVVSKAELKDNSILNQITIVEITIITLVLNFYFGSSNNSAKQAAQITEMQKDATTLALTTANPNLATNENKVDKAVKIAELKAALEALEPESDEAIKIVAELEALEKIG